MPGISRAPTSGGILLQVPLVSTQDSEPTVSVLPATSNSLGVVKPDNVTITVGAGGVLSAAAGPNPAVTAVTGVAPIASTGGTAPAISIAAATTLTPGAVQPDGTTITVNGSIISTVAGLKSIQVTLTAAQVNSGFTTPNLILGPQGAGTLIVVSRWILNAIGSTPFIGGGNLELFYGSVSPPVSAASGNIVSTLLTTLTANQVNGNQGQNGTAGTTVPSSIALNAGIYLSNVTAPFTGGAGSTLTVIVQYYVLSGLS